MQDSMMAISVDIGGQASFRMIPVTKTCPYLEAIYLPDRQILVLLSPHKKDTISALDDFDKIEDKNTVKNLYKEQFINKEHFIMEAWHEYQITNIKEIIFFVSQCAVNGEDFLKTYSMKPRSRHLQPV